MSGKYSDAGEQALWDTIAHRCSTQAYNLEALQISLRTLSVAALSLAKALECATEDATVQALAPTAKEIEELVLGEFRGEQAAGTARTFLEARHAAILAMRPPSLPRH